MSTRLNYASLSFLSDNQVVKAPVDEINEKDKIMKTIVWNVEESANITTNLLTILPLDRQINEALLSSYIGCPVNLSPLLTAESITGQKVGTISPFGHKTKLRTLIDKSILEQINLNDYLYVGCGEEGFEFRVDLKTLIELTKAEIMELSIIKSNSKFNPGLKRGESLSEILIDREMEFSPSLLRKFAQSHDTDRFMAVLKALEEKRFSSDYVAEKGIDKIQELTLSQHINAKTQISGKTALHLAAWKGKIDHVGLLLSYGANIDLYSENTGNYGKTALFYAITQNRDDMVKFLLNHGASVLIVNNKGQSPRSLSLTHLQPETIILLKTIEQKQIKDGGKWLNFYLTHRDPRRYGDLDFRFVSDLGFEEKQSVLKEGEITNEWEENRFYSFLPTTPKDRLKHHFEQKKLQSLESSQLFELTEKGKQGFGLLADDYVDFEGIIVSKRKMSKILVFATIVPQTPFLVRKNENILGIDENNDFNIEIRHEGSLVQLIIGKTLRNKIGEEEMIKFCKQIKNDIFVSVKGKIQNHVGKQREEKIMDSINQFFRREHDIDIVVSDIKILEKPTTFRNKNFIKNDNNGNKNEKNKFFKDTTSENESGSENSGFISINKEKKSKNKVLSFKPFYMENEYIDKYRESNYITLDEILTVEKERKIILVDNPKAIRTFTKTVEKILNSISLPPEPKPSDPSIITLNSLTETDLQSVIGIDCEWRPSRSKKENDLKVFSQDTSLVEATLEDTEDVEVSLQDTKLASGESSFKPHEAPVAVLQISTRFGIFIFDVQTVFNTDFNPVPFETEDGLLENPLELLVSSFSSLFRHSGVLKLGFDVTSDFERLAVSFPIIEQLHFSNCFHQINGILDLKALSARLLRPAGGPFSPRKKLAGLTHLCEFVLGRGLDKKMQCSPWHIRPLLNPQLEYAAIDAAVLIKLFDHLSDASRYSSSYGGVTVDVILNEIQRDIFNLNYSVIKPSELPKPWENYISPKLNRGSRGFKIFLGQYLHSKKWFNSEKIPTKMDLIPELVKVLENQQEREKQKLLSEQHKEKKENTMNQHFLSLSRRKDFGDMKFKDLIGIEVGFNRGKCISLGLKYLNEINYKDFNNENLFSNTKVNNPNNSTIRQHGGGCTILNEEICVFFINCMAENPRNNGKKRGTRNSIRYPNEFLENGEYFTFYINKNHYFSSKNPDTKSVAEILGSPSVPRKSRKIMKNDLIEGSQELLIDEENENQSTGAILFMRAHFSPFLNCGPCTLHAEEAVDKANLKLTFRLTDFHLIEEIRLEDEKNNKRIELEKNGKVEESVLVEEKKDGLKNSKLFREIVSAHQNALTQIL